MKKVLFSLSLIAIVGMVSCSRERSGNREVTNLAKIKKANGELDWIRLNPVEFKVFKVGDSVRVSKVAHRISSDTTDQKAIIVSIIN